MRAIKFRAWDPFAGQMVYNDGRDDYQFIPHYLGYIVLHYNDCVTDSCANGEHVQTVGWGTIKDAPVMQFTGLHDRDGREIYEGDIIEFDDLYFEGPKNGCGGNTYGTGHSEWRRSRDVVKFAYCMYMMGASTLFDTSINIDPDEKAELEHETGLLVVGNIYENPELLEAS